MKLKKWFTFYKINNVSNTKMILVRLIVGLIFLTDGIQKFLYPELLGTGRFIKLGFSNPEFWAYFTGTFEIICGTLIIVGLLTRLACIPLLIIMIVAFITSKLPTLMNSGFWTFAHDYRTDFAMTFLLIYLLINGSGMWSVDSRISKHMRKSHYRRKHHEHYRK